MPAKLSRLFFGCLSMLLVCSAVLAQVPPAIPLKTKASSSEPTTPSTTRNQAGVIVLVDGNASLTQSGVGSRQAKVGDIVSEGDLLISGKNGEVHVQMQDSGFLLLRPNSRIQIVKYRADGGDDDSALFRLVTGGLRSITGWIGKFNSRDYRIQTPNATVGIRGTDHETRYIPEGSSEGEAGTYDRVFVGQTSVEASTEKTTVAPNQAGFVPLRREGPRLLTAIPGFFRPGPHEAEIDKKHAEIQRLIDQRREERRKVIAEKRAALEAARTKSKQLLEQNKAAAELTRQTAREQRSGTQAKWEALQRDVKAAEDLHQDIQEKRKALEADIKSGQISRPELRDRRKALQEKDKALAQMQESIKQRRKTLMEATDGKIDQRFDAAQERQKAMRDQLLDAREKRKSLEEERESTTEEMKALRQQENKRYLDELKKDRTSGDEPPVKK